jgi:enoyl-[acyl-carrier protein] reductase I
MSALGLSGRRLVVTGVLTRASIGFAVAARAQGLGAEVVLTGFGRRMRMTERAAGSLPRPAPVVPLDVNSAADLDALAAAVGEHAPVVDGVLHSIAFAPQEAINGDFVETEPEAAAAAYATSAHSLEALVLALEPLLKAADAPGASVVALDFDATQAWPGYDWMGVAKAGLAGIGRDLAARFADRSVRVNLLSAGPVRTPAAGGIRAFDSMMSLWKAAAPLGWTENEQAAVADVACYLLSPWSAGVSGERVHVDGGMHALGMRHAPEVEGTTAMRVATPRAGTGAER